MNQRMAGDIQLIQDGGPVDAAVTSIRRKANQQNPADFATSTSAGVSQEDINQLLADLQMKQVVPSVNQQGYGIYPFA